MLLGASLAGVGFVFLATSWLSLLGAVEKKYATTLGVAFFVAFLEYSLIALAPRSTGALICSVLPLIPGVCFLVLTRQKTVQIVQKGWCEFDAKKNLSQVQFSSLGVLVFVLWLSFSFFRIFIWPWDAGDLHRYYVVAMGISVVLLLPFRFIKLSVLYKHLHLFPFAVVVAFCVGYMFAYVQIGNAMLGAMAFSIVFVAFAVTQLFVWVSLLKVFKRLQGYVLKLLLYYLVVKGAAVFSGVYIGTGVCFASGHSIPPSVPFLLLALFLLCALWSSKALKALLFATVPRAGLIEMTVLSDLMEDEKVELLSGQCHLSQRESQISLLLYKGLSRKEIRQELSLSEGTVNSHISNIYKKTGTHSQAELMNRINALEKES